MAFSKQKICHLYTFMMIIYLRKTTATNIDCGGKPFHCVNSTHFMICVDLGAGVSQTVDDYMIRCPLTTVCLSSNHFECEYRISTTKESTIRPSDVTNESEIKKLLPTNLPSSETSSSKISSNFNTVTAYTKADFMTDDTEQPRGILDITGISTVPIRNTDLQYLPTTGSYAVEEIISEVTQMNSSDNIDPLKLNKLSNDNLFYQELTPSPLSTKLEQVPSLPLINEERVENIGQANNSYAISINNLEGYFNDSASFNVNSTNATFVDSVTELITKDTPNTESLSFTHLDIDNMNIIDSNISKYSTKDLLNITRFTDFEDRAETLIASTTEGMKTLDSEKVNEINKKFKSEIYTKSTSASRMNLPNLTISGSTEINQIISPISSLTDFSNSNDLGKKPFEEITTTNVLEKSPKDLLLNENIVVEIANETDIVLDITTNDPEDLIRQSNTGKSLQEIPSTEIFNKSTMNLSKAVSQEKSKEDFIKKKNIAGVTIKDSKSINKNGILYNAYTEAASKDTLRSGTVNTIIYYPLKLLSEDLNTASTTINKTRILQGESMNAKFMDAIFNDTTIKTVIEISNQTTNNTQSFTDSNTLNTIPTVQSLGGLNTENSMDSLNTKNIFTESTSKTVLNPSDVQSNWPREILDSTEITTNRILPAIDTNLQFKTTHTYTLENLSTNGLKNYPSNSNDFRGFSYQNSENSFQTLINPLVNTESTQASEFSLKFTNSILHTTTKEPINKDSHQLDLQRIGTIPTIPTLFDSLTSVTSGASYNTASSRTDNKDDRTTKPSIQNFSSFDIAPKQRPKIITTTAELPLKNLEHQQTKNKKNIKSADDKESLYLPYEMNGSTSYALTSEPTVNLTLVPAITTTDNATQETDNYTTYKNLIDKNTFSDVQNTAIEIEIKPTSILTNKTAINDFGGSTTLRGILQLSLNKTSADTIVPFKKDLFETISKIKIEPTKEHILTSPLSLVDTVPAMRDESTMTVTDSGSTINMQADTINFGRNGLNKSTQDFRPAHTLKVLRESITSTSVINSVRSDITVQTNNENPLLNNNLDATDVIDTMTTLNHISLTTVTPSIDSTEKMQKDTNQSGKDGLNIFTPEDLPVDTFKALPDFIISSSDIISVSTNKTAQKISAPLFPSNNVSDADIVVPVNNRIFDVVPKIKTKPNKEYVLRSSPTLTDPVTSLEPEEFSTRITVPTDYTLKMQTDTIQPRKYGLNIFSTQDRSSVNKFKTLPESITLSSDIISVSTNKKAQTQEASQLSLKFTSTILHTTTKEPINKDLHQVDLQRVGSIPTIPTLFDSLTLVTSGASYNTANSRFDNIEDRTAKPLIHDVSSFDLASKQRPKIITATAELPLKKLEHQQTKNEKNIKSADDKESLYLPYEMNGSTSYALTSEPTVNLTLVPAITTTDNATQETDNYTTYKNLIDKNTFSDVQNTAIEIEIKPTSILTNKTAINDFGGSTTLRGILQLSLNKTSADTIVPFKKDLFETISKIKIEPTKEHILTSPLSLVDTVPAMRDESTMTVTDSGSTINMQADTINFGRNGLNKSTQDFRPAHTLKVLRESITSTSVINSVRSDKTVQTNNENPLPNNNLDATDVIDTMTTLNHISLTTVTPSIDSTEKMQKDTNQSGKDGLNIFTPEDLPVDTFKALPDFIISSSDIISVSTNKTAQKISAPLFPSNNVSDADIVVPVNNRIFDVVPKIKTKPNKEYVLRSSPTLTDAVTSLEPEEFSTRITVPTDYTLKMQTDTIQPRKYGLNIFSTQDRSSVNKFKTLPESIILSSDIISVSTNKKAQTQEASQLSLKFTSTILHTTTKEPINKDLHQVDLQRVGSIPTIPTLFDSLTLVTSGASYNTANSRFDNIEDRTAKPLIHDVSSFDLASKQRPKVITATAELPLKKLEHQQTKNEKHNKSVDDIENIYLPYETNGSTTYALTSEPIVNLTLVPAIPTTDKATQETDNYTTYKNFNEKNMLSVVQNTAIEIEKKPTSIITNKTAVNDIAGSTTLRGILQLSLNKTSADTIVPFTDLSETISKIKIEPTKEHILTSPLSLVDTVPAMRDESTTTVTDSGSTTNVQADTINFGRNGLNIKSTQNFRPAPTFEAFKESTTSIPDINSVRSDITVQINNEIPLLNNNLDPTDVIVSDNNYLLATIFKLKEPTQEYVLTSTPISIDTITTLNHISEDTLSNDSAVKMHKDTNQSRKDGLNIFTPEDLPVDTFKALPERERITSSSDIISVSTDKIAQKIGEPLFTSNNVSDTDIIVPVDQFYTVPENANRYNPIQYLKMQTGTIQPRKYGLNFFSTQDRSPVNIFKTLPKSITLSSDFTSVSTDKTAQKINKRLFIDNNENETDNIVPVKNHLIGTISKIKIESTKEYVLTPPSSNINTVTPLLPEESTTTITLPSDTTLKMLKDTTQSGKDGLNIFATKDLPVNVLKDLPEPITLSSDIISVSTDKTVQIINEPLLTNNNVNDMDNIVPVSNHLMGAISNIKTKPTKEYVFTSPPTSVDTVVPLKHEESTKTVTLSNDLTLKMQNTVQSRIDGFNIFSLQDFGPVNQFKAITVFETSSPDVGIFTTDKSHGKDDLHILSTQDVSRTNKFKSYQVLEASLSDIFNAATDKSAEKNNKAQFTNNKISNSVASTVRTNLNSATFSWNKSYTNHLNTDSHTDRLTQINLPTTNITTNVYNFEKINDAPVNSETDSTVTPKKAMINENIPTSSSTVSIQGTISSRHDTPTDFPNKITKQTTTIAKNMDLIVSDKLYEIDTRTQYYAGYYTTVIPIIQSGNTENTVLSQTKITQLKTAVNKIDLGNETITTLNETHTTVSDKQDKNSHLNFGKIIDRQETAPHDINDVKLSTEKGGQLLTYNDSETTSLRNLNGYEYANNRTNVIEKSSQHISPNIDETMKFTEENKSILRKNKQEEVLYPINLHKVNRSLSQTEQVFNSSALDSYKKGANSVKGNISVTTILTPFKIEELVGNLNIHGAEEITQSMSFARTVNLEQNIPKFLESITDSSSNASFINPKDFKRSPSLNSSTFIDDDGLKIRIDKEFIGKNNHSVILSTNDQKLETPRLNNNTRNSAYKMSGNLSKPTFYKSTVRNQDEFKTKERVIKTLPTSKENNDYNNLLYKKGKHINNSTTKLIMHVATFVSGNSENQFKRVFIAPMTNSTKNYRTDQSLRKPEFLSEITSDNQQTSKNVNTNRSQSPVNKVQFTCVNRLRGRYADKNDCKKFYICIGQIQPLHGECPANTVFSQIKKQCTKNLSHCINNHQFDCIQEGRFIDILKDNIYYICVKNENSYIRFQFQCQGGYHLNKTSIKCMLNNQYQPITTSSTSIDSDSNKASDQNTVERISKEKKKSKVNAEKNICSNEGKFPDPNDCRRYYVCSKKSKSVFRRKTKKCDSDEVFHREKKKCVSDESYECN